MKDHYTEDITDESIFLLDAYEYDLPEHLIAQAPSNPVDSCKLMVCSRTDQTIADTVFKQLPSLLDPQSVIFFNDSKVIKARLSFPTLTPISFVLYWWTKIDITDGELFYLWSTSEPYVYKFLVKPWSKFKVWTTIRIGSYTLSITGSFDYGRLVYCTDNILQLLDEYGQMPLPPYISYDKGKESDYQPIVAKTPWSVASPTASLHFTPELLNNLKSDWVLLDYVTLHVWLGTFRQIKTKNIRDYEIHSEMCEVDIDIFDRIMHYQKEHKTIVAVWTTSCRTLESLPYLFTQLKSVLRSLIPTQTYEYRTNASRDLVDAYVSNPVVYNGLIYFECMLYIIPWYRFRIVNQLITNFHLPKSSLMLLLASFMWYRFMMNSYEQAIKKNYKFYSFGDAMLIQ